MQDSLEDYLRLSRNVAVDEATKISKEMQATAQLKKECDARAMKIVEFSIEGKLKPEVFTKCLPFINQSHYQDIVEERAITKLCGYSVCGKRIPDMPKKQYFISTKSNRVYDITERKNFCSNFCYKASLHIKKQIDNSPLWLRKLEDIPEYKLLGPTEKGLPGELIEQNIATPVLEPQFTSISSFVNVSLNGLEQKDMRPKKTKKHSKLKSTMQTIKENDTEPIEEEPMKKELKQVKVKKEPQRKICFINLPIIEEKEEAIAEKQKPKIDIEGIINKALNEWLTLETCIFIHGQPKVKQTLGEDKLKSYFEVLNVIELQCEQQNKYIDICHRLQLQELTDDKFDKAHTGGGTLKPPPNYKKLKEECLEMTVKVKSFYQGGSCEKKPLDGAQSKKEDEVGPPAVLPPVDCNSQNMMRRRIFLSSLNKAMHQLLFSLGMPNISAVLSDLQGLVKTFHLKADNITFKPIVWNYIALVLLDLLSLKDEDLKLILEEERSQEYINILLSSLPNKKQFLDDVLNGIRNIDIFVQHYITADNTM